MNTKLDGFVANIQGRATRLIEDAKWVTRIGVIGIAGLTTSCSVEVPDDFNARLHVVDAAASDSQDGSVVNPTDTIGLDASTMDISQMDIVQPTVDTVSDVQAPDATIDSLVVQDSSADTYEAGDSQIADTSRPTDQVALTDMPDTPLVDLGVTDLGSIDSPTDGDFDARVELDVAGSETETDLGGDVVDASDTSSDSRTGDIAGDITDAVSDTTDAIAISDSTVTDARTDTGTDAGMTGPVINRPSGSAQPSCSRIIIEGIPGCLPGSTTCEYNTRTGGALRYYLETVTIPTGWTGPAIYYRFQSMLREPQISDFTGPDTAQFTPVFTNGIYPTRVTMVLSPAIFSSCNGPTITIVTR